MHRFPRILSTKGMATTGLLAHVLVAKYADHLALYLLKAIFGRASVKLARSMLAEWVGTCGVHLQPLVDTLRQTIPVHRVVHADETPVQILQLGTKKPHRACLWTYAPGAFESLKAVIYDFTESRAGEHARAFLGDWQGSLLCDDDSGYKASFIHGITEIGCMAHARRKFFELHAASQLAEQAMHHIGQLLEPPTQHFVSLVRRRFPFGWSCKRMWSAAISWWLDRSWRFDLPLKRYQAYVKRRRCSTRPGPPPISSRLNSTTSCTCRCSRADGDRLVELDKRRPLRLMLLQLAYRRHRQE